MNIKEREHDGVTVFDLAGRIDSEGAMDLEIALQAAVSGGKHKLVLEMAEVSYVSSAGLRTLADVLTRCREADGDMKLVAVNRKVLRVLRIIGFDKFFSLYDSLEAAVGES